MAKRVPSGTSQKSSNFIRIGWIVLLLPWIANRLVGAIPWLMDKSGFTVPVWAIDWGIALAIPASAYVIWHTIIELYPESPWPLPSASVLAFLAGFTTALWINGTGYDPQVFPLSKQEVIYKKTFTNEKVDIDGKRFDRSYFQNVTFIYHGLGKVEFGNNSFSGSVHLHSDNVAIGQYVGLMKYLRSIDGFIGDDISTMDADGDHFSLRQGQTNKQPEQIR